MPATLPQFRTLYFEDQGQDCTRWTINQRGKVTSCGPFQASTWCGCTVIDHEQLKVGVKPVFVSPHVSGRTLTLSYKIIRIKQGRHNDLRPLVMRRQLVKGGRT